MDREERSTGVVRRVMCKEWRLEVVWSGCEAGTWVCWSESLMNRLSGDESVVCSKSGGAHGGGAGIHGGLQRGSQASRMAVAAKYVARGRWRGGPREAGS